MNTLRLNKFNALWKNVETDNISKTITLSLNDGNWLGIYGENGIGKSTLLKAIAGLIPFTKGEITLNDQVLKRRDPYQRHQLDIMYIPQHSSLEQQLNMEEIYSFARQGKDSKKSKIILKRAKKYGFFEKSNPPRISELLIALLREPKVLLIDEVNTSDLDIYSFIKEISPDTIVLFVDHNIEMLFSYSDIVLRLSNDESEHEVIYKNDDIARWDKFKNTNNYPLEDESFSEKIHMNILSLDKSVLEQIKLGIRAYTQNKKEEEVMAKKIFHDFSFLKHQYLASLLSGGQKIVLLFFLTKLAKQCSFPKKLLRHLDTVNKSKINEWEILLNGKYTN